MSKSLDTIGCHGTGTAFSGFIKYIRSKLASVGLRNRSHDCRTEPVEVDIEDPLGPLPKNWEMRVIINRRKVFFAHLDSKTTQWEDPRTHGKEDPLPPGWIMKTTGDFPPRVFIDQNTDTTTYVDPREEYHDKPNPIFKPVPNYMKLRWKLAEFDSLCQCNKKRNIVKIYVRRENLVNDSYSRVMKCPPHQLRGKLSIKYVGEKGFNKDVADEWFYSLSCEIFDPKFGLFKYADKYKRSVEFNPESAADRKNSKYFRFIGRFIAMALYHNKFIHKRFTIPFYRALSAKRLMMKDIESIDPEFYNSLLWIQKNNIEECGLELFFGVNYEIRDRIRTHDLETWGRWKKVNEENKSDFLYLITFWKLCQGQKGQLKSFVRGFNEVFPSEWLYYFDETEIENMLFREPEPLELRDWKENTTYINCSESHIRWFWRFVKRQEYKFQVALLLFVTGTRQLPVGGFADLMGTYGPQRFCIKIVGDERELPRSNTCFNRLELPPYRDYQQFERKMMYVLLETVNTKGYCYVLK